MKTMLALSLGALLGAAVPTVMGQATAPPLPALPSGFQSDPAGAQAQAQIRASGAADATGGSKANEDVPGCPTLRKITFGYSWTTAYLDKATAANMFSAPQDPAKGYGLSLDEPVSKIAYKNGVLEWRKDTEQIAGFHAPCPGKFVYYNGTWSAYFPGKAPYQPGKLVSIQVTNLYKSQGQGQAWIDEYIDKLTLLYGGK